MAAKRRISEGMANRMRRVLNDCEKIAFVSVGPGSAAPNLDPTFLNSPETSV